VPGGTIVIAATTVSIALMGLALALRPLFSGKKIPVEWICFTVDRPCHWRGHLASTPLSASRAPQKRFLKIDSNWVFSSKNRHSSL
jgi:hypothetical protein